MFLTLNPAGIVKQERSKSGELSLVIILREVLDNVYRKRLLGTSAGMVWERTHEMPHTSGFNTIDNVRRS